jgi:hypothetical protein
LTPGIWLASFSRTDLYCARNPEQTEILSYWEQFGTGRVHSMIQQFLAAGLRGGCRKNRIAAIEIYNPDT